MEPKNYADYSKPCDFLAGTTKEADNDINLEITDEERINTMDLLAELQNQQGTENLVYMKSISESE